MRYNVHGLELVLLWGFGPFNRQYSLKGTAFPGRSYPPKTNHHPHPQTHSGMYTLTHIHYKSYWLCQLLCITMYVLAHIPNPPLIFKIGQNLGLGIENRIGNDAGGGRAVPKLDGTQVDGACIGGYI
jgi:hypothetical protein